MGFNKRYHTEESKALMKKTHLALWKKQGKVHRKKVKVGEAAWTTSSGRIKQTTSITINADTWYELSDALDSEDISFCELVHNFVVFFIEDYPKAARIWKDAYIAWWHRTFGEAKPWEWSPGEEEKPLHREDGPCVDPQEMAREKRKEKRNEAKREA